MPRARQRRHPLVMRQSMRTEPGSASHDGLQLLANWADTNSADLHPATWGTHEV